MNLGTHAVLVARTSTPCTKMFLIQSASTAVTVAALEAIHEAIVHGTKASFASDATLEISTLLAVDLAADRGAAKFDQTGTSRLVAKDELALIALANVLFDTVDTELAITGGTISLLLANGTECTVLVTHVVLGTIEASLAFLAVVARDECLFAIFAAETRTRYTGIRLESTSTFFRIAVAATAKATLSHSSFSGVVASFAPRLATIATFTNAFFAACALTERLVASRTEQFRNSKGAWNHLFRHVHDRLLAATATRLLSSLLKLGFS